MMKQLLTVSAIFEFVVGIGLMVMPAAVTPLLLGYTIQEPAVIIICGVTGAALMTIALACWLLRNGGTQAKLMVWVMLCYNLLAGLVLVYGALGLKLSGMGMWPAIIAHIGLAAWCVLAAVKK